MRLTIVRHGETVENKNKITQGHMPGKLSRKGIRQAKKVALRLKKDKFNVIYVSDLKRTIDTAKEIIKFHPNTEVIYEPLIRERKLGEFEGTPSGSTTFAAEKSGIDIVKFRPKNGESIKDMQKRAKKFFNIIKQKHKGKNVLIISHGGLIVQLMLHMLNEPDKEHNKYHPNNTAISIIEFKSAKRKLIPKLIQLNCEKHLK